MDLKAKKPFGMCLENLVVNEVRDRDVVNPGLDPVAVGDDAKAIPLSVFEVFVRLQSFWRSQPSAASRFAVHVTSLGTFLAASLDFDLRAVNTPHLVVLAFARRCFFGLRTDLYTRVQAVMYFDFEFEFKVVLFLVAAQKRIRAAFVGCPLDRIAHDLIFGGPVLLGPTF